MSERFREVMEAGYAFSKKNIVLGVAMHDGNALKGLQIKAPLSTFNRHGLITGATGTGKTKSLQAIAELLSEHGVPSLLMDIKGDLSGLAAAGQLNDKLIHRHEAIGNQWSPMAFPVELLTISDEKGTRMRATVSEFGPVLFSRILGLNDTQSGAVSLIFKYCDDKALPLLDLKDFKKVLQYLTNEGKKEIEAEYGRISPATASTIVRKIIEIEQQGAECFFGERSFDVSDLMRTGSDGRGILSILRLTDMQSRPKMFSTFMLCLLAEIYQSLPESGDAEKPRLVLFIDEAHLIFREATDALLEQIETIVRLIRSKGVGVFFITQSPTDIPPRILGQLGMKVQHALRAFTAADRKAIKAAAENFPESEFYKVADLLTALGIGEALVTVLNEKGIPTPLAHTMMAAPRSRMDVLSPLELQGLMAGSSLSAKYNEAIDRDSAYEILSGKLHAPSQDAIPAGRPATTSSRSVPSPSKVPQSDGGLLGELVSSAAGREAVRTMAREITRGLLGVLGMKRRR
jgi:DNA helicase HerA-like ATPase